MSAKFPRGGGGGANPFSAIRLYIALQFYIKTSEVISNVFDYIHKVIVIVIITFLQVL